MVVSVTVVAPESGRDGDRVMGFEDEEDAVELEVFVVSARAANGLRRPREDACSGLTGISLTGTTTSSIDRDLRFFERERERDLLRKLTSWIFERVGYASVEVLHKQNAALTRAPKLLPPLLSSRGLSMASRSYTAAWCCSKGACGNKFLPRASAAPACTWPKGSAIRSTAETRSDGCETDLGRGCVLMQPAPAVVAAGGTGAARADEGAKLGGKSRRSSRHVLGTGV
jgi:hypothetical protein